jgi:serine/threonine protein kinase
MNLRILDQLSNELDRCGNQKCGNIITTKQMKNEDKQFQKQVLDKCPKAIPKSEEEDKQIREKYEKCFNNLKNNSDYAKKKTRRKQCETTHCIKEQNKLKQYMKKSKNIGGGNVFTLDGKLIKNDELFEGKKFFQKMTKHENEKQICKLLMQNPHKNIVTIYEVGDDYIKMELLNTALEGIQESVIKEKMRNVKNHLQSLGIMYIDWKSDNIGISEDGELKLFDFDASGIIEPMKWETQPQVDYYSYRNAIKKGMKTPIGIDNYVFENTNFFIIQFTPLKRNPKKSVYSKKKTRKQENKKRIATP